MGVLQCLRPTVTVHLSPFHLSRRHGVQARSFTEYLRRFLQDGMETI